MDDPLEDRLRNLMRDGGQGHQDDAERLERVLHKAHLQGGLFDLLTLFSRWGQVLSEPGNRQARDTNHRHRSSGPAASDRSE